MRPKTLATMIVPGPNGSYGLGTYRMRFDGRERHGHDGFYYDPAFKVWYALTRAYDRLVK